MSEIQVVTMGGIEGNISPFAFQHYAKDFYEAYKRHKVGPKFSPARLFLIARSIELAAKSLHLGYGRTTGDVRRLGHDIEAACAATVLSAYSITITPTEQTELKKANNYYSRNVSSPVRQLGVGI